MTFRVAVSCCNNLFGEGIRELLKNGELDIEVAKNYTDPKEIAAGEPDLIIADFTSLSRIFADWAFENKIRILLLESECLPLVGNEQLFQFISKGLVGMLSPHHNATQFRKAIKAVVSGELWFDRKRLNDNTLMGNSDSMFRSSLLTKREAELAELVCNGHSNKEIMEKLLISEQTVKSHLNSVYKKLGIKDRLQLCILAKNTNSLKLQNMLLKQNEKGGFGSSG